LFAEDRKVLEYAGYSENGLKTGAMRDKTSIFGGLSRFSPNLDKINILCCIERISLKISKDYKKKIFCHIVMYF